MLDYFSLLPDELFTDIIFPQLHLLDVIQVKQVSKKYKTLVSNYQEGYNRDIYISYEKLHLLEDNLPNSICYCDIYVTEKIRSITSYKVLKHLSITFISSTRASTCCIPSSKLYEYKQSLDHFDVSNLCHLHSLSIFDALDENVIPSLALLTNLTKLEIIYSNITANLYDLLNLTELLIMNSPNITSFPTHLKLFKYVIPENITVVSTEDYQSSEDVH